ncbi:uncharacterized protein LOC143074579 [Mytilus galloprovincialis]|uniref:uncharacterized protein LOC143074579 n=1 Tax=Mytilus galloprovincialis TaxID=29158 RepID=UPI003F7C1560
MRMRIKNLLVMFVLITVNENLVETCQVNEFECSDGNCIPIAKTCDYDVDCPDRSDEIMCPTVQACPEGLSRCSSGKCVVRQLECSTSANFGNHTTPENKSDCDWKICVLVPISVAVVCFVSVIIFIVFIKKITSSKSKTDPED